MLKGGSSKVPTEGSSTKRGFGRGSRTFCSQLFPCNVANMPLLAPLVDWTKAARAAVGTWGYAGHGGLGCTDLIAHPDTKVEVPLGTTIARIRPNPHPL